MPRHLADRAARLVQFRIQRRADQLKFTRLCWYNALAVQDGDGNNRRQNDDIVTPCYVGVCVSQRQKMVAKARQRRTNCDDVRHAITHQTTLLLYVTLYCSRRSTKVVVIIYRASRKSGLALLFVLAWWLVGLYCIVHVCCSNYLYQ